MNQRQGVPRVMFLCACAAALTAIVLAGDVNPPPGPVGPSGPSLSDLLLASAGPGSGAGVSIRTVPAPPAGSFETVSLVDGVVQRAILANFGQSNTLIIHLQDASGLLTQCAVPPGQTQSVELGMAYTAPLETAVIGQSGLISVSVVVQESD